MLYETIYCYNIYVWNPKFDIKIKRSNLSNTRAMNPTTASNHNTTTLSHTTQPMIEIVAPATLMEGYRLDTQVGDRVMTIVIPPGGVEKGQKFSVPLPGQADNSLNGGVQKTNVPVGHWKDGMLDCCQYGCCHASVCTSCWCHALAAGQVISRLQLNWLGKPTNSQSEKASAFPTLFTISMVYFGMKGILFMIIMSLMPEEPNAQPPDSVAPFALMNDLVNYAYFFLSVYVIYNVRYVP